MPRYSVQVPVTILVNFTVDAPNESAAISTDLDKLRRKPIMPTFKGIEADHPDFSIGWIGADGYKWDRADADLTEDPTTLFVDHDGKIYPDAATRDAAIAEDEDDADFDSDND